MSGDRLELSLRKAERTQVWAVDPAVVGQLRGPETFGYLFEGVATKV